MTVKVMNIPYFALQKTHDPMMDELDAAYRRVMEREWFIDGQEDQNFEKAFADYCGAACCVGVGNGLDALRLILIAAAAFPCHLPDDYPVLMIHATNDMAVPRFQHEALKVLMYNCDVTEAFIKGGNHGQFGDYAPMGNEGVATISKKKQLDLTMKHILKFMNKYQ